MSADRRRTSDRVRGCGSRDLDPPTGEQLREVIRYEHDRVGDLVHVDVKKLGRIPTGGAQADQAVHAAHERESGEV
ncbi:hypothetical protein [Streptomyces sp. OE57]|uniref:hypothetical protein n=1 Tax=Streptomyces lacaronensis TaxID=3379885 RepID=UPI0039B73918